MGCTSGKVPGEAERPTSKEAPAGKDEKLLDKYVLGKVLGQGAFGVVYSCKRKGTKEEYAVKMIDQVETPVAEIKQEADMLKKLAHPCIVKLHDVYYEKVFVCMVLEIYKGGDMIEGMQLHWKSKGMIPVSVCQNMTKMMFQSIDWLHQNNVVHRDVKGDNYLQDRREIENPNCRIYLSDFGTVVEVPPGGKMKQRCGTKTYWAPEFYALNYGLKVDIWALGVVLFGMVTGRFPFKGEQDTKDKTVKSPSRVADDGGDFIKRTLDRNEAERISAKEALQHPWLSAIRSAAEDAVEKMEPEFKPEVREAGANAGVKERRRELVERLQDASQRRPDGQRGSVTATKEQLTKGFEVQHEHGEVKVKFEWWSPKQVEAAKFYDATKAVTPKEDNTEEAVRASEQGIKEMLESHGIETSYFGKGQAKKFVEFVTEVQTGQARLMLDATKHKTVVRVVDLVLLRIVYGQGENKKFLIKSAEKYPDGRMRGESQLAGSKKLPHENGIMTAERLVKERMPILDGKIKFNFNVKECFEEEEDSPSYPGVKTIYRKEIYEGSVSTTEPAVLESLGLSGAGRFEQEDKKKYTRYFCWLTEKECDTQKITLKAKAEGSEISPFVAPPIGYEEEQLQRFLQASNVDISKFGKEGVKSLAEFSEELVAGESTLMMQGDGSLIRVVDVVILKIFNNEGNTLVEVSQTDASGAVKETKRLPAVKRRNDENQFWAAHRVMNKNLRLSEDLVQMDPSGVQLVEESTTSKAYAGLPTLYRRRIIPCKIANVQLA